jgi:hypothetical protein
MSNVKAFWSTHLGRAVLVALIVALAFLVVRLVGLRPASALELLFVEVLDETGLEEPIVDHVALYIMVVGLLGVLLAVLVGAVVGLVCRISGWSVTATGWVSGVVVAALQLPFGFMAMPIP